MKRIPSLYMSSHMTSKLQSDCSILKTGDRKAAVLNLLTFTITNARKGQKGFFQDVVMKLCRFVYNSLLKACKDMCLNSWISKSCNNTSVLLLVVRTWEKLKPETRLRKITFFMGDSGYFSLVN